MRTLASVLLMVLLGVSVAEAATKVCAIVPFNSLGIEPREATKVSRWVRAAVAGLEQHRVVSQGEVRRQLSQTPDCESSRRCLAAAARKLPADLMIAGDVGSLSGVYVVYLRAIGQDGRVHHKAQGNLDPKGKGLRAAVHELAVRLLTPSKHTGGIDFAVDVKGAWIYLDGRRVGRGPELKLEQVRVGTHAVRVTHDEYRDFVGFVDVRYRRATPMQVDLSALPVDSRRMRLLERQRRPLTSKEMPWYRRWWAVATFGVVVAAATTAGVSLLVKRAVDRDAVLTVEP